MQGLTWGATCAGFWHSGGPLPRVTFAVRPRGAKRAVRNEQDIVAAIR